MSKSINISNRQDESLEITLTSSGNLQVNYETCMGKRKQALYVSDKSVETSMDTMIEVLRGTSKFVNCSIGFEYVDYYDDEIDCYEVPYGTFTKGTGKRKARIGHSTHGSIPKDWNQNVTATFAHGNGIKPIQLFLDVIGITDEPTRKAFETGARKVIQKKGRSFYITPEDVSDDKYTFNKVEEKRYW